MPPIFAYNARLFTDYAQRKLKILENKPRNLPCRETTPNDYETNICTTSFCKAKIAFNIFCVQSFFSKCTIRSQNRRRLTRQNLQRTPLLLKTKRIGKDNNKRCTNTQLPKSNFHVNACQRCADASVKISH